MPAKVSYIIHINPCWDGHFIPLMKLMWPIFIGHGVKVVNLCHRSDLAERMVREELPDCAEKVSHIPLEVDWSGEVGSLAYSQNYWFMVAAKIREIVAARGPSGCILNQWAEFGVNAYTPSQWLDEAMVLPWYGVYLNPTEFRLQKPLVPKFVDAVKNLVKGRRIFPAPSAAMKTQNLRGMFLYDENVLEKAKKRFGKSVVVDSFPDVSSEECDESFEIPELEAHLAAGKKIVACLGVMQRRKGVLNLLRVAGDLPPEWTILVAGEIRWDTFPPEEREELRGIVENRPSNVLFFSRCLADPELNSLVKKSHVLYLGYLDFYHSSNLQIKAAQFHKPVIVPDKHLLAERIKKYNFGYCINNDSSKNILSAFQKSVTGNICKITAAEKYINKFLNLHSTDKLIHCASLVVSQNKSTNS
jgi:hypothetical protein